MIVMALLLPTLLGFLIISVLLREAPDAGLIERLSLSYPLGMGMLTMQIFMLGLLRVDLTLGYTMLPLIVEIGALCLWISKKDIMVFPRPSFGLFDELTSSQSGWLKKSALVILTAWVGVKLGSIFVETVLRPIYAWDAWYNWSAGAKLFYFTKSLMLDVPLQDFFTRGAVGRYAAYPVHNPLMQTWISLWIGGFDEVFVKLWNPVYLLSMAFYLYRFTSREIDRLMAMGLLVIFLSSPLLSYHAIEAYSDLALSAYLLLALISFLYAMRGKRAYWPLAGLFLAEAMFTKEEALFFSAPLLMSAVVFILQNEKTRTKKVSTIASLLTPLLFIAPWYLFKFTHGLGFGTDFHWKFVFHPGVIIQAFQSIYSLGNFNVIILFLPILILVSGKPSPEFLRLFFVTACYAFFFIMLYACTDAYYDAFIIDTGLFRNVLTYYPALAILIVLLIKKLNPPLYGKNTSIHSPLH